MIQIDSDLLIRALILAQVLASVSETNKIKFAYLLFGPVSFLTFALAAPLFIGVAVLHLSFQSLRVFIGGLVYLLGLWSVLVGLLRHLIFTRIAGMLA